MISIIIITNNRTHLLKKALDSLVNQKFPAKEFEIILIDSSKKRTTENLIKDCYKDISIKIVYQKFSELGTALARNKGLELSKGDIIAFIDDDCIADPCWIAYIKKRFIKYPDIVGVEGRVYTVNGQSPFVHYVEKEFPGNFATCNIAYKKEILEQVGGFDPIFTFQNEDIDLAYNVLNYGEILYCKEISVLHPPRVVSIFFLIQKVKKMWSEFYIYKKHPLTYKKFKGKNPIYAIKYFFIGLFIYELRKNRYFIHENKLIFLEFLAVLLIQRIWLLFLLPYWLIKFLFIKKIG